ncbi:hypothetical protein R1sor_026108 [Riccia sorocarpa]|uniref:Reverse transcriptase zinc-binding domain-containing protein n=1 Tax=Riccia sorocarpa TaxID=122646 RepID=A0ABD3GDI8_9MARC
MQDLKRLADHGRIQGQERMGETLQEEIITFFRWVRRIQVTDLPLQECSGWRWITSEGTRPRKGWNHETKWWKSLLGTETNSTDKLSRRWEAGLREHEWNKVWNLTWRKPSTVREGFWWWRTLWQGFWTGDKALKATVSNGDCPRCCRHLETVEHLFWTCPSSRTRRNQLLSCFGISTDHESTWLRVKLHAIDQKMNNAALWAVLAELYRTIWRERDATRSFETLTRHESDINVSNDGGSPNTSTEPQDLPPTEAQQHHANARENLDTTEGGGELQLQNVGEWSGRMQLEVNTVETQDSLSTLAPARATLERVMQTDRFELAETASSGAPSSYVGGDGPPLPVLPDCLFPGH